MTATTPVYAFPYPETTDAPDGPSQMGALALAVETALIALDARLDALEAWTAYTPVWGSSGTAPALGNGTITGRYIKVGKLVFYKISLVLGTTSTVGTGTYTWTLPPFAASGSTLDNGSGIYLDASTSTRYGVHPFRASGATLNALVASTNASFSATAPVVPATSDRWDLQGFYEAA